MNSVENYAIRYLEPKDVKDLDQYNALLRYTFQVTEDELMATGWKDEEIKQSKFPVLERADVLGCFDGDTLISQFALCTLTTLLLGYKTAERLYALERIEGKQEAVDRLDDVLYHKIPYISNYI